MYIIVICLIGGIICGYFSGISSSGLSNHIVTLGLLMLLFSVGIDFGKNREILNSIKENRLRLFIIPMGTIIGTIVGSLVAGIILSMPVKESVAVGAGFGWYSLSGVLITQLYSVELGTMAFISNVVREVIALLIIPFVSKYVGSMEAIGIAGATAMDTSLPVIVKYTSSDMVIFSFLSGLILTLFVPLLIPIILNF